MSFSPPHWYYTQKVIHPTEEVDQVINKIEVQLPFDSKDLNPGGTTSYSTYETPNPDFIRPESIWNEKYGEIVQNAIYQLGLNKNYYYKYHYWAQLYKKGQQHVVHNHFKALNAVQPWDCASISMVHFIKNSSKPNFKFVNQDTGQILIPKQEEGDIIFFPSYIYHTAMPNKTNIKRFVVALNISLVLPHH